MGCSSRVPIGTGDGSGGASGGVASAGGQVSFGGSTVSAGGSDVGGGGSLLETSSKLDLLFVIDNSFGMEHKLPRFRQAALSFLQRLIEPRCVGPAASVDVPVGMPCPSGTTRERSPVRDLHVGVITTNLGAHGGQTCGESDDKAHLIATVRSGIESYSGLGFAKWDPAQTASPPGLSSSSAFVLQVSNMLDGVGIGGCGYEASLESWYRFLVDPSPPERVIQQGEPTGLDTDLLAQRAAFLRPDSAVSIVVVSDENDCSIRDGDEGWLVTTQAFNSNPFRMPKATSACQTDPNDRCCMSCAINPDLVPDGCSLPSDDVACRTGGPTHSGLEDSLNLRCWDQKRRFGVDLLYPTTRYVGALTQPTVFDRALNPAPNPLFTSGANGTRGPKLINLTTLVGVPWQDLSVSPTGTLTFQNAEQLALNGRWNVVVGEGETPADPFMRESVAERDGANPITGDLVLPSTEVDPLGNAINGHELAFPNQDDLQNACTFALQTPVVCGEGSATCACSSARDYSALCQASASDPPGSTQYRTGAKPGLRQLRVQSQIGSSAVVGTICVDDAATLPSESGYAPSFEALAAKMRQMLP
ncbi:MAG TPA: hypothetical protein VFQ35_25605 [Polyangiaceae bacterium]|nr:hypothetical protein [Polyangiaceae bacterium]